MRAAQALADIFGLDFEWGVEASVDSVRQHCQERYPASEALLLETELRAGKLTL
jgi:hypothetical protein